MGDADRFSGEDGRQGEALQRQDEGGGERQLSLAEWINCLVRIAFFRANPQWGSKFNKKDLTPVPESMEILLQQCILPRAKRDNSAAFKKVLAADTATQAVFAEYRERLQGWLQPSCARSAASTTPTRR